MTDTVAFMRSLDERFRAQTGLVERRLYSIFYSQVSPSRILILGLNPGGDPNNWGEQSLASQSFYENGEHEYVDCDYPIAVAMRAFLPQVLGLPNVAAIRAIPKTNLIFRRSRDLKSLSVPVAKALDEARPFVEEIIRRVQPQVVICEGIDTLGKFEAWYCVGTSRDIGGPAITTPNGRSNARIFRASRARIGCIDRDAALIGIGHPSKYATRVEWPAVISRTRAVLEGIAP